MLRGSEAEAEHIGKRPNPKKTSLQADGQKALARLRPAESPIPSRASSLPCIRATSCSIANTAGARLEPFGKNQERSVCLLMASTRCFAYPGAFERQSGRGGGRTIVYQEGRRHFFFHKFVKICKKFCLDLLCNRIFIGKMITIQ